MFRRLSYKKGGRGASCRECVICSKVVKERQFLFLGTIKQYNKQTSLSVRSYDVNPQRNVPKFSSLIPESPPHHHHHHPPPHCYRQYDYNEERATGPRTKTSGKPNRFTHTHTHTQHLVQSQGKSANSYPEPTVSTAGKTTV